MDVTRADATQTNAAGLEAVDLYRFYHVADEEVRALRGVSLTLAPGELVALLGASGSGKSTLLACLAGLDDPDGGFVDVDGARMTRRPEAERATLRGQAVGIMLQSGNLLPQLNVLDNVTLAGRLVGEHDERRARELLDRLGLGDRVHALPQQLSGGETARASLAAALAHEPKVLLADEPTAEVDAATEEQVLEVLHDFCRAGGAALISTHSLALAGRADRALHLKDGRWTDV